MEERKLNLLEIRNALVADFHVPLLTCDLFLVYHKAKPEVWQHFERFALSVWESGRKKYGAKGIMERVRWHVEIESNNKEDFKVQNNFTAYYARIFLIKYPEAKEAEFFNIKELKGLSNGTTNGVIQPSVYNGNENSTSDSRPIREQTSLL